MFGNSPTIARISGDALLAISICAGLLSASQANGNRGPLAVPQDIELEHGAFSGLLDLLDEADEAGNRLAIQRHDGIGGSEAGFFCRPVWRRQDDEQGMRLIEAERLDGGGVQLLQLGAEPARFGRGGLGRGRRRGPLSCAIASGACAAKSSRASSAPQSKVRNASKEMPAPRARFMPAPSATPGAGN